MHNWKSLSSDSQLLKFYKLSRGNMSMQIINVDMKSLVLIRKYNFVEPINPTFHGQFVNLFFF